MNESGRSKVLRSTLCTDRHCFFSHNVGTANRQPLTLALYRVSSCTDQGCSMFVSVKGRSGLLPNARWPELFHKSPRRYSCPPVSRRLFCGYFFLFLPRLPHQGGCTLMRGLMHRMSATVARTATRSTTTRSPTPRAVSRSRTRTTSSLPVSVDILAASLLLVEQY